MMLKADVLKAQLKDSLEKIIHRENTSLCAELMLW